MDFSIFVKVCEQSVEYLSERVLSGPAVTEAMTLQKQVKGLF